MGRAHTHISTTEPNWSREAIKRGEWAPSKRLLLAIRRYQALEGRRGVAAKLLRKWWVLQHRFWSAVSGADIPMTCSLAGGLVMPHPNGIVIHAKAEVGPNCLLFQQVTLGAGHKPGLTKLGGHVDVGAGAKILGGVTIGDHAMIGANSVVLDDVPERSLAVGIPARVIPDKYRRHQDDRD